jgi:hypothetical protein
LTIVQDGAVVGQDIFENTDTYPELNTGSGGWEYSFEIGGDNASLDMPHPDDPFMFEMNTIDDSTGDMSAAAVLPISGFVGYLGGGTGGGGTGGGGSGGGHHGDGPGGGGGGAGTGGGGWPGGYPGGGGGGGGGGCDGQNSTGSGVFDSIHVT